MSSLEDTLLFIWVDFVGVMGIAEVKVQGGWEWLERKESKHVNNFYEKLEQVSYETLLDNILFQVYFVVEASTPCRLFTIDMVFTKPRKLTQEFREGIKLWRLKKDEVKKSLGKGIEKVY